MRQIKEKFPDYMVFFLYIYTNDTQAVLQEFSQQHFINKRDEYIIFFQFKVQPAKIWCKYCKMLSKSVT